MSAIQVSDHVLKLESDNDYGFAEDSFIFSFKDKDNIENYILSRVMNNFFADKCRCNKLSYKKLIREINYSCFSVEEYEVFQIQFVPRPSRHATKEIKRNVKTFLKLLNKKKIIPSPSTRF